MNNNNNNKMNNNIVKDNSKNTALKYAWASVAMANRDPEKLKKMGVKVIENVDKSGFTKAAAPIQDQLAAELGPHAVKILKLVREVK